MGYEHPKYTGPPPEMAINSEDLRSCKYCKGPLVWLDSKKTGKKYPVNADPSSSNEFGELIVKRNDFHNCAERNNA